MAEEHTKSKKCVAFFVLLADEREVIASNVNGLCICEASVPSEQFLCCGSYPTFCVWYENCVLVDCMATISIFTNANNRKSNLHYRPDADNIVYCQLS